MSRSTLRRASCSLLFSKSLDSLSLDPMHVFPAFPCQYQLLYETLERSWGSLSEREAGRWEGIDVDPRLRVGKDTRTSRLQRRTGREEEGWHWDRPSLAPTRTVTVLPSPHSPFPLPLPLPRRATCTYHSSAAPSRSSLPSPARTGPSELRMTVQRTIHDHVRSSLLPPLTPPADARLRYDSFCKLPCPCVPGEEPASAARR